MKKTDGLLRNLGVFGYDHVESVVIASLVTGKPLLLIGKAGTGKSYLLNSLSEAFDLDHRHYNASLIAFDDLVGFPYPEEDGTGIRYIETPVTVWGAESVLIDEISRCKPEHQNRLFSLVHERRIQGMKLEKLRYCWAAMNPCSADQGVADYYDGSVPLDQALADRFAFIINVPDWEELEDEDRERVADPAGEGALSTDDGRLRAAVNRAVEMLPQVFDRFRRNAVAYAVAATDALGQKRIRLSPRRVRLLAGNLLALTAVEGGEPSPEVFLVGLRTSLPQPAWGASIDESVLLAAHAVAWEQSTLDGSDAWLNSVLLENRLERRIEKILLKCPDDDTGAIAVRRLLATLDPVESAILALSLYPAALRGRVPVGAEGIHALGRLAQPILEVEAEINWQERLSESGTRHQQLDRCSRVIADLRGKRKKRACQLFYHLVAEECPLTDPPQIEESLHQCIQTVSKCLGIAA